MTMNLATPRVCTFLFRITTAATAKGEMRSTILKTALKTVIITTNKGTLRNSAPPATNVMVPIRKAAPMMAHNH